MKKTKYIVKYTSRFKRDYKLAVKRNLDIALLENVIATLAMGKSLPENCKDQSLSGNWRGFHECHILPDWLLIYRIEYEFLVLTLARTGSHAFYAKISFLSCNFLPG